MKKVVLLLFLSGLMILFCGSSLAENEHESIPNRADIALIEEKYSESLQKLFVYRDRIKSLHPLLERLHPVAIVENKTFYVFDIDEAAGRYVFASSASATMPIPPRVRAAFPLDFYHNRAACVVTGDVFDSIEGYVIIFHEFVHCYQWNTVEPVLRKDLPIAVKAAEEQNYMWELNHPFPYVDPSFEENYKAFIEALDNNDLTSAAQHRNALKESVSPLDFQYMVWQEWKEGFALFLENRIREQLQLERNMTGRRKPYNRTVFYAGGESLISSLSEQESEILSDLELLFKLIKNFPK